MAKTQIAESSPAPCQPKKALSKPCAQKEVEMPLHQSLGTNLSQVFMAIVLNSQSDPVKVLQNLGLPPNVDGNESLLSCSSSSCSRSSNSESSKTIRTTSSLNTSSITISSTTDTSSTPRKAHQEPDRLTYTLKDFAALEALETLIARYGRACHMGVRDQSYAFFINEARTGALCYKIKNGVAILGGDPLSPPSQYLAVLKEFEKYCKKRGWTYAVMGGSDVMAAVAKERKWTTLQFGVERILNPMTNPVLLGKSGKRIVTQCKQLLKAGVSVELYCQTYQRDPEVEAQILQIYQSWRNHRNRTRECQAFMTVFELFALPRLMAFVYTKDANHKINGFAALRRLGNGYHVDPFLAALDAPRGITDLLLFASMAFLKEAGISHLSLGFEPFTTLADVTGMPKILVPTTRTMYKYIFGKLPLSGKEAFHQRFYPDQEQDGGLHLIFPRTPRPKDMFAMTHFANIKMRKVLMDDLPTFRRKSNDGKKQDVKVVVS